ncbi:MULTISPECIES: HD domain-containing protein [unclassified Leeuwenhoekiella]|uniref:HD domain-containing protein n=1 Tax=unclassified Leeuwenhoekiella TaxID=2615029 RepID=UPI000C5AD787|nr:MULTISPECIES: HD domain-containing protein [unclassified Leeuwenhoekiella]MAW96147.1 phosphohydrolase [Leeuwenhoekiella sp.]MBA80141.1 phosphohydrolase [Leeuwenhoekiella sp.]|tara:strand:- start:34950 stop:35630 length:681 start_codon:yes stop_codon:yes gene_type:complete
MTDTVSLHLEDIKLIERTRDFVKETLANAEGGHDWFHILRVYKNALHIAKGEKTADVLTLALASLLHDIADSKFHDGDEEKGPKMARAFLVKNHVEEVRLEAVVKIIENVSFRGGHKKSEYTSLELQIVQDADRLDAIGAIGIARTFNYGGFKNRKLYDPAIKPDLEMSAEDYKKSDAPTINHFYEKLLLLKDQMHTQTAKEIAEERHAFMETFLEQFYAEWEGIK